jgi:ketosteroid isomerase-like protein
MKLNAFIRMASLVGLLVLAASVRVTRAVESIPAALLALDEEFARTSAAKGLEGWLSYFAEDAAIFPRNAPIVRGKSAIREQYAKTHFTPEGLTWKPVAADAAASGDLGYTYGTWQWTGKDADGKPVTQTGKYFTEWKKQKDGTWKLVADFGAPDLPPPAAKP